MSSPAGMVGIVHQGVVSTLLAGAIRRGMPHWVLDDEPGGDVAWQRNVLVRRFLAYHRPILEWLGFVDSDQVPQSPLFLEELLSAAVVAHAKIVSAVVNKRSYPFDLNAFTRLDPQAVTVLDPADVSTASSTLMPVAAVGTGCLLVHRTVFEAVEAPWFRVGVFTKDRQQEDIYFTREAARLGFQSYVCADVRVGHLLWGAAACVVWPGADGRPWLQMPFNSETRIPIGPVPEPRD